MKIEQVALTLAGGSALYLAMAILSRDPAGPFGASVLERLAHPMRVALADESGTRLKAKYIAGADGSKLYDSDVMHDSQLNVDCKFTAGADGQMRCVPVVAPAAITTFIYFKNAACSERIALLEPGPVGCTPALPTYVFAKDSPPYCGAAEDELATHVYPLGSLIGASSPVYRMNGSNCEQVPAPLNFVYYDLLAELPAATFERATAGTDP